MKILAIETSCDETAIAIIEGTEDIHNPRFSVLSNLVLSQVALHAQYGGVFPSLAKREHAKNLIPLLKQALEESNLLQPKNTLESTTYNLQLILEHEPELLKQFEDFIPTIETPDIDLIAVTNGPGLEPALWVGVNFAKALSSTWGKPVMPVNHMEGHIFSALLKKSQKDAEKNEGSTAPTTYNLQPITFPILALLISGGHTELVLSKDWFTYEIVGQTRDDAVGEAFDKVARMLDLPYPGGPQISKLAEEVRISENKTDGFVFPRPMMHSGDFNFSFSGLKTAVLYALKKIETLTPEIKKTVAYAFEEAVTEVLVKKTVAAAEDCGVHAIVVGGGVSANKRIRESLSDKLQDESLFIAPINLTGDNALMIAAAGYLRYLHKLPTIDIKALTANGNMRLGGNKNMVQ